MNSGTVPSTRVWNRLPICRSHIKSGDRGIESCPQRAGWHNPARSVRLSIGHCLGDNHVTYGKLAYPVHGPKMCLSVFDCVSACLSVHREISGLVGSRDKWSFSQRVLDALGCEALDFNSKRKKGFKGAFCMKRHIFQCQDPHKGIKRGSRRAQIQHRTDKQISFAASILKTLHYDWRACTALAWR